jgi:hypothetical protein
MDLLLDAVSTKRGGTAGSSATLPAEAKRWHPARPLSADYGLPPRVASFAARLQRNLPVFWIFAALVLLSVVSVIVSQRGPVRTAGFVVLAVVLGIGLFQRLMRAPNEGQVRGQSASPAAVVTPIGLEFISATQLVLSGGGAPFELRGRIANGSPDMQLSSVTMRIKRRDCHPAALDPQGCDTVWEDQHWMPLIVPAGESREFVTAIWAHSPVPRTRGSLRDEITLVAATGEPRR